MSFNMNNVIIWDTRMRNPEPLTQNQKSLINCCPYLSRVRSFSKYTNFDEYYKKNTIERSFTWACDENCVCLRQYEL